MRPWIRRFARRRRLIGAALAALAMLSAHTALSPSPGPTTDVLIATRDLSPGPLQPGDLRRTRTPRSAVPDGAVLDGKTLATPMRRGEILTDVRLLGTALLARLPPGTVATPVRVADPELTTLLTPGAAIGVMATWEGAQSAHTVAERVTVMSVMAEGLIVVASTPEQAAQLAAAQASERLSITLRS
ncbi:flagellar biosynthesis protein FlgA [Nonomuraea sp. NPDC050663]|uniref:flagellar biosynthesis protein FlgA n=1 Tax=Nonomuraea sp. NPDC050663 TaxID=3364370 RepID=UPI0037BAD7D1